MNKNSNLIIAIYFAILTILTLIVRRFELFDSRFIDIFFLFLISIPFRKGNRNLYILYSVIFLTSIAYFKNYNYNDIINIIIIIINGIFSFINIYFGLKTTPNSRLPKGGV